MADSDYIVRGSGALTSTAFLTSDIEPLTTVVAIQGLRVSDSDDVKVGMAAMIDDEIVRIDGFTLNEITIARGCADTIPSAHEAGTPVWLFGSDISSDRREYLAGETVGVKVLPHTPTAIPMAIADVPPRSLTFNQRFFRPYPPAEFKCKGDYWFTAVKDLAVTDTELLWSWNHRDRLVQADQLIDHNDADIGPEVGTTYTARVYNASDALVRTVTGITGKTWSYPRTQAEVDLPGGAGYVIVCSVRDGVESLQSYRTDISVSFGVPTDPEFANVSLLLHMNGTDNSTAFIDSSVRTKTVTPAGNAKISAAQSKFGGASGHLDGAGDYLSIPHNTDLNLSSGNFTIEAFVYVLALTAGNQEIVNKDGVSGSSYSQYDMSISSTGKLQAFLGNGNGVSPTGTTYVGTTTVALNQWHHVEMVVSGSTCYGFLNGYLQWSGAAAARYDGGKPLLVGYQTGQGASTFFNGYIDEVRITKGVARHTANFTPPTLPFPDLSAYTDPQYSNVSLLLHMDNASVSSLSDNSPSPATLTVVGSPTIDATNKKFGSGALQIANKTSAITVQKATAVDLTGSYTVEAFVRSNAAAVVDGHCIITTNNNVYPGRALLDFLCPTSTEIKGRIVTPNNTVNFAPTGVPYVQGTWVHIAFVNDSTNNSFKVFIGGVLTGSRAAVSLFSATQFSVGQCSSAWNEAAYQMDELRITQGVARYTADFTPPVLPFPNA